MLSRIVVTFILFITFTIWSAEMVLQNGLDNYDGFIDASNSSIMKTWNNGEGKELYSFNCSN